MIRDIIWGVGAATLIFILLTGLLSCGSEEDPQKRVQLLPCEQLNSINEGPLWGVQVETPTEWQNVVLSIEYRSLNQLYRKAHTAPTTVVDMQTVEGTYHVGLYACGAAQSPKTYTLTVFHPDGHSEVITATLGTVYQIEI